MRRIVSLSQTVSSSNGTPAGRAGDEPDPRKRALAADCCDAEDAEADDHVQGVQPRHREVERQKDLHLLRVRSLEDEDELVHAGLQALRLEHVALVDDYRGPGVPEGSAPNNAARLSASRRVIRFLFRFIFKSAIAPFRTRS